MYYHFLHQHFHRFFLPFQHLSLSPAVTTSSSEDLLNDTPISLDVNCSPSRSCEASSLLPYVSLFESTFSDLEFNTEDEYHVTPPDSYQNNNGPPFLDQFCHLTNAAKLPDQDLYDDDNYDLAEDEVGSFGTFGSCPPNRGDYSKDDGSDFAVDSDIGCLPEAPDDGWHCRDWSPDSLSDQEYDQDSLGKVSSSGADSLSQPLKIPTSLCTGFEDILDPLHLGCSEPHNSNFLAIPTHQLLAQTEDNIQACLVSQGIMVFDLVPKSSQSFNSSPGLFSDQHSGRICEYGGVITDDDFDIEFEFDVEV